jgi:hypothetical protein
MLDKLFKYVNIIFVPRRNETRDKMLGYVKEEGNIYTTLQILLEKE